MPELTPKIPRGSDFTSRLRSPAVAARVGLWLGICFLIAFVTGSYSHVAQAAYPWFPVPSQSSWTYRVTQGVHVAAAIFQLASGLANAAHWYPWGFSFVRTHFAIGWVAVGAMLVHVAVKLPVIRQAMRRDLDDSGLDRSGTADSGTGLSRRGLLRTTLVAASLAVASTAGATVPALRHISVFGVRSGAGPGGIPINRSARAAGVEATALARDYALNLRQGDRQIELTPAPLAAMPQHTAVLPIACVEGWSATGRWTGVRVGDLVALLDAPADSAVLVRSLQPHGAYRESRLPPNFVTDGDSLLALRLAGEPLSIDHGYPCRIIAPKRPGVLQVTWVSQLEVET